MSLVEMQLHSVYCASGVEFKVKTISFYSQRAVLYSCTRGEKERKQKERLICFNHTEFMYSKKIFHKMINTYYHDKETEPRNSTRSGKSPSWESNKQYAGGRNEY